jgi:acetyltransferase-like isoleucine patch superfamily enzyme
MRKNYTQAGNKASDNRTYLDGDWYPHAIPSNVSFAPNVFIDTSYGFAGFRSKRPDALVIDEASGCYDRASFIVSENGKIKIGKFCILNGSTIICNDQISIGDHCMLAWGAVITDTWLEKTSSLGERQNLLLNTAQHSNRDFPLKHAKAVIIEDNVWVGFDAVVLPGVRLGKGCVVSCKTVIDKDIPAYAVVAGSPARVIKFLNPDDTDIAKQAALNKYIKKA